MHGRIAPLDRASRFCEPALTVEVRPGDNLMIHAAMALAKPGDVIVVDGKGDQSCALMGSIMANQCKALGVAAVVLDAASRDADEILELGFPMYSVGTNPNGPTKLVPGRVNHPIQCGGVTVRPGDLVIGDADGVVVVERERVAGLIGQAAGEARLQAVPQTAYFRSPNFLPCATKSSSSLAGLKSAPSVASKFFMAASTLSSPIVSA